MDSLYRANVERIFTAVLGKLSTSFSIQKKLSSKPNRNITSNEPSSTVAPRWWISATCLLESDSYLPKKLFYLLHWKPFKNDEKCFLFHLKSSFCLKIFTFLFWVFDHVEKTDWSEIKSREVKATRQWNLIS